MFMEEYDNNYEILEVYTFFHQSYGLCMIQSNQDIKYNWSLASRWETLVGKPHVGVYTIIQEFQKEQYQVETHIEKFLMVSNILIKKKPLIDHEKE